MKLQLDEEFDLDEELEFEKDDVKRVGVLFQVEQMVTDSTEYKILSPTFKPKVPLFVELQVEESEITKDTRNDLIKSTEEIMVITQNGFIKMLLRYAKLSKDYERGIKNG